MSESPAENSTIAGCKLRLSALPVLTYLQVRCAPVLKTHHFRRALANFGPGSEPLTAVQIIFLPDYLNHWLRFGIPNERHDLDRRRSLALFGPGCLFGYVRWQANEYGTQGWRFTIVQTCGPSAPMSRIEGVLPGGEVLLIANGKAKVQRALLQIDALEKAGFDPADVSPAFYRHLHNRIASGKPVRAYDAGQHAAHLAVKKVIE